MVIFCTLNDRYKMYFNFFTPLDDGKNNVNV